jgi:hypothetical protein
MKGRRVLVMFLAACAFVALLAPSVAQAANTTCANADYIFPGERAAYTIGASGSLFFKTRVTAGRSYTVIAWGPTTDASEGGVNLSVELWSDNTCAVNVAGLDSTDYEPYVWNVDSHAADQDSVIPTADGTLYIQVANALGTTYTTHVLVMETTLFSPWWFVGGTNQAYIEMRNNMTAATVAHVTAYRANGTVCGTTDVNVAANGNAAVEVATLGSCAGAVSGSAQISFAGTPGGMVANITTLNVTAGTSFDSPFAPRMAWSTFSR